MRKASFRFLLLPPLIVTGAYFALARPQEDSFTKNFKQFKDAVRGIDFFAGSREDVSSFEKPHREASQRLASFLGEDLAKGAIVICSSLAQKDSVSEAKLLKMGYRWALIQLTFQASNQLTMEQIKSQLGGKVPPAMLERFLNPPPEAKAMAEARLVQGTVQRFAYAVISTTIDPTKEFRSSRLDDMGRSPLADWLDIGLAVYAAGGAASNLRLLQDRLDEAFPLEDVLSMSRPFVAPPAGGSGGAAGLGMVIRMAPGAGAPAPPAGGAPSPEGQGGRPVAPSVPKDIQDRMTFDQQAASFFTYLLERIRFEKTKELVEWNRAGKPSIEFVTRPDVLGPDLEQIEKEWQEWVKRQKAPTPGIQIMTGPPPSPKPL